MRPLTRVLGAAALLTLLATGGPCAARGEIPLPAKWVSAARSGQSGGPDGRYAGLWAHDAWSESRPAAVLIDPADDGLHVIHAYDRDVWRPFRAAFHENLGHIEGDQLVVPLSPAVSATFRLLSKDRLFGRLERRGRWRELRYAIFERIPSDLKARRDALAQTDARPWRMVDIPIADPDSGKPIIIKATYYPPTGSGPAPLLLMNHGDVTPGFEYLVQRHGELARLFASRGWAVLEMMRRGTGGSGGVLLPEFRSDGRPPSVAYGDERMAANIADVDAVLAAVRRWPQIDGSRILLGGQSRGGLVALEYLAARPGSALGAVNFAGAGWCEDVERATLQGRYTRDRLALAGTSIRQPTWWFYGDNDQCSSAAQIRSWFEVYRAAGGSGELTMFSGVPGDGHGLITHPVFWERHVLDILHRLQR